MSRINDIINLVLSHYKEIWSPKTNNPFPTLVRTILSQNTNRKNTTTAYQRLENHIGISPRNISKTPLEELIEAIKPAGMYKQRSRYLKEISRITLSKYDGTISSIFQKPLSVAREELMQLPGVGPKTADVSLMFGSNKKVIPVDRHINRIVKRLELVKQKANYETIRKTLEKATNSDRYMELHLKLIKFGREICRARNPECNKCLLYSLCPWHKKSKKNNALFIKIPFHK